MSEPEEWRSVPHHPQFEVTSSGRIRSVDRVVNWTHPSGTERTWRGKGGELSPWMGNNGYKHVSYQALGKRTKYLVHRMVGLAFVPGFEPGLTINHKNGIKTDNRAENLEWITTAANTAHQWKIGLVNLRGQNNPHAKLTDAQAQEIKASRERVGEAARRYGVSTALIYKIRAGLRHVQTPPVS